MEIVASNAYTQWLSRLRDREAQSRIAIRIARLADGNPGDVAPVGGGISELRINYGPGYRVYYVQRGQQLIILLAGGDKDSQQRDIAIARRVAREM